MSQTVSQREQLERDWLDLTRHRMPTVAGERGWPVRLDHCFQRILLDNACGTVWYERISKRPAYAHAPDTILRAAIALGESALAGAVDLAQLDDASLRYRGKRVNIRSDRSTDPDRG